MGKKKAKKKIPAMPKLGLVDQMIYVLGYLLILTVLIGGLVFFTFGMKDRMLEQPGAVAYEAHGSNFWAAPFYMTLLLSLFIPWLALHSERFPFFGKRGVKYGPPAYPRTFPLFMKNKPQYWKSPTEARLRRAGVIAVVVLNLLCALLAPLSIYGRDMLYENGTLRDYSMFNNVKREYEPEDAEEIVLSIGRHKTGRYGSYTWRLTVRIDYGNREYRFYNSSFSGSDWVGELDAVLRNFDPALIRLAGTDRLDDFGRKLSEENYEKLCAIFERYG